VSRQQGFLEDAEKSFRSVLEDDTQERRERGFDFSLDFRVRNSLGLTLLDLSDIAEARGQEDRGSRLLRQAEEQFQKSLEVDSEDVTAHANLALIYRRIGQQEKAGYHEQMQLRYKMDDNAGDVARPIARRKYPAADHAAESLVIYWLQREGAPGLPEGSGIADPTRKTAAPIGDDEQLQNSVTDSREAAHALAAGGKKEKGE
jgi:tetratricopeptide (TPR) repeat protein